MKLRTTTIATLWGDISSDRAIIHITQVWYGLLLLWMCHTHGLEWAAHENSCGKPGQSTCISTQVCPKRKPCIAMSNEIMICSSPTLLPVVNVIPFPSVSNKQGPIHSVTSICRQPWTNWPWSCHAQSSGWSFDKSGTNGLFAKHNCFPSNRSACDPYEQLSRIFSAEDIPCVKCFPPNLTLCLVCCVLCDTTINRPVIFKNKQVEFWKPKR